MLILALLASIAFRSTSRSARRRRAHSAFALRFEVESVPILWTASERLFT